MLGVRARSSETVITAPESGEKLPPELITFFKVHVGNHAVKPHGEDPDGAKSIAVPTRKLRETILADTPFRRALRDSNLRLQDIQARWGRVHIGDVMYASGYVKETKTVGVSPRSERNDALALTGLKEKLEDLADRMPLAVIVLIAGGTVYMAWRLGDAASRLGIRYAERISAAAGDAAGQTQPAQQSAPPLTPSDGTALTEATIRASDEPAPSTARERLGSR
ncbi:MAG: hypothetical protein QY326_08070 [Bdellovibrionota bacterium]|nr:MAG: hypothetical protein QY326_08070 [Bdellovibrionota bacterium]